MKTNRFLWLKSGLTVAALFCFGFLAKADTFVVDTVSDANLTTCTTAPNDCSLRGALNRSNSQDGSDVITFTIPGSGVKKIAPAAPLPILTDEDTLIDGTSQIGPGSSPLIELSGENIPSNTLPNGLTIQTSDCTIRKINIHGWFRAILISGSQARNNSVEGCYIGTDPTGLQVPDAKNVIGIHISNGAKDNSIGGTLAQRNVISANSGPNDLGLLTAGIYITGQGTTGNFLTANLIGTNRNGMALGGEYERSDYGVFINQGASRNYISYSQSVSNTTRYYGNLISGNRVAGVRINNSSENRVEHSIIGLQADGTALGNGTIGNGTGGDGIQITAGTYSSGQSSQFNIIGNGVENRNIISGHQGNGILLSGQAVRDNVVATNFIGTDATGKKALRNVYGVLINQGASDNIIGDKNQVGHNLISGNDIGVSIQDFFSGYNTVQSNYIGTDVTGTQAIPNAVGVEVIEASQNSIGPLAGGTKNVISGNNVYNIRLTSFIGSGSTGITGNFIGTTAQGDKALGNASIAGIYIQAAQGNLIGFQTAANRNIISGNGGYGILISGAPGNIIEGNFIGLDATGRTAIPNGQGGIAIEYAPRTSIGGPGEARNLISGNAGNGISIFGNGSVQNKAQNNFIGVDITGNVALPNDGAGVLISSGASNNLIGGTSARARNVISGNKTGVYLLNFNTTKNTIAGNYIGTNSTGTAALHNSEGGIFISNSPENLIGGTTSGSRNLISGNWRGGIVFGGANSRFNNVQGNYIGLNAAGNGRISNTEAGIVLSSPDNSIGGFTSNTGQGAGNVISGQSVGILMKNPGAHNNKIQGNLIGTDATGTSSLSNRENGIVISSGAYNNLVGGSDSQARNVISSNTSGHGGEVLIDGAGVAEVTGNKVQGNYLGLDIQGSKIVRNGYGSTGIIIRNGAHDNFVGGFQQGEGNVISTTYFDVLVSGSGTSRNVVQGNLIGTDATGLKVIGATSFAVQLENGASDNLIGGSTSGARNIIVGAATGINLTDYSESGTSGNRIQGNWLGILANGAIPTSRIQRGIGIGDSGTPSSNRIGGIGAGEGNIIANTVNGDGVQVFHGVGNSIRGNSIYNNAGLGINLGTDYVTLNDAGDADSGPNELQNFPVLESAQFNSSVSKLEITGRLDGTPNHTFAVDVYLNETADPSGYGEGQIYVGSFDVNTNSGVATFQQTLTIPADAKGTFVTATATDNASGSTSEFSKRTLRTTVPPPSPQFSTTANLNAATFGSANASSATITLDFATKLKSAGAIQVKVNGDLVEFANSTVDNQSLTILLPPKSLKEGDKVEVRWQNLMAQNGQSFQGQMDLTAE